MYVCAYLTMGHKSKSQSKTRGSYRRI